MANQWRCKDEEKKLAARCQRGVTVIIPALNEEESLSLVLEDLPAVDQVIVVDNGSTDGTPDVAAGHGALVVTESVRGYGAACHRGLLAIEERVALGWPVPEIVVFLDADYSDHPELLPLLVEPIQHGQCQFVLGSRLRGSRQPGAMPFHALLGNKLACLVIRLFLGARFTDLGPFRAIDYAALKRLDMTDRGFGWTLEMQIKAIRAGLAWKEIPVPYRRRIGESKISGSIAGSFRASISMLALLAKHVVLAPLSARIAHQRSMAQRQTQPPSADRP